MTIQWLEKMDKGKLYWRCRRGMLELDLLLIGFLEHEFDKMCLSQQHDFVRLLALPDQELQEYLMELKEPRERGMTDVIKQIRLAVKD